MMESKLRLRKAYPQHWYDISIGNSKSHLTLVIDTQSEQLRCELYIPDSKELFAALLDQKEDIGRLLPYTLEWMELPGKKASRIRAVHDIDVNDREEWDSCFGWLVQAAESFYSVFSEWIGRHV